MGWYKAIGKWSGQEHGSVRIENGKVVEISASGRLNTDILRRQALNRDLTEARKNFTFVPFFHVDPDVYLFKGAEMNTEILSFFWSVGFGSSACKGSAKIQNEKIVSVDGDLVWSWVGKDRADIVDYFRANYPSCA